MIKIDRPVCEECGKLGCSECNECPVQWAYDAAEEERNRVYDIESKAIGSLFKSKYRDKLLKNPPRKGPGRWAQ